MDTQLIDLVYLFSAICFILALKGLASPQSARNGNILGMIGMLSAIGVTFYSNGFSHHTAVIGAIVLAAVIGAYIAKTIPMTAMPQLVAGFHSFVGLAAVLVAYSALLAPESFGIGMAGNIPAGNLIEMSIGAAIGALTFTGSIIAFGKLQGLLPSKPLKFIGQQYISAAILIGIIVSIAYFAGSENLALFHMIVFASLLFGILLIIFKIFSSVE